MLNRRHLLAAAAASAAPVAAARAQDRYPSRIIRFIVPRAPGGGSDILSRLIAPALSARLGQTVVVENRPDATAIVGAELTARSQPDGYTLYISDNSFYFNPSIVPRLPYDTLRDFSGVTMMAQSPALLLVKGDSPYRTVQDLVNRAKAEPGKLTFSSGGVGASTHFAGVLFGIRTEIDIVHVVYRSSGPALTALMSGEVDFSFGGLSSAGSLIRAGNVRALAATAKMDAPALPPIPTMEEAGIAGVDLTSVWGIHAPAGTPIEVRRTLRDAVAAVMRDPALSPRLTEMGYDPICNTPEEHERQAAEMVNLWIGIGRRVDLNK